MFRIYIACGWWYVWFMSLQFAKTMHNCIWFHCARQLGVIVEHIAQVADICVNVYTMRLHLLNIYIKICHESFTHQVHWHQTATAAAV